MILSHDHVHQLESESIFLMREVAAQFERPVLLFSGGKDSILMVHLARKAFAPARIPFTLVHIDTGHNFPETLEFRDALVEETGATLHVGLVQDSIDAGRVKEEEGPNPSRNGLQTVTLLDTLSELKADVALGGGRRDEEKARAKERFFSHRDRFGQWDPKNQRPELWNLFNGRRNPGEHFRAFPLSNWTEMDVWQYIADEEIPRTSATSSNGTGSCSRSPSSTSSSRARSGTSGRFDSGQSVTPPALGQQNPRPRRSRTSSRRLRPHGRRSVEVDRTTNAPRPRWKTARSRGTSDACRIPDAAAFERRRIHWALRPSFSP
jgi:3'-phosphoadenosine 5'-phosphosulfate sulfotransferase (PAPS reductase)/FAD synthetase